MMCTLLPSGVTRFQMFRCVTEDEFQSIGFCNNNSNIFFSPAFGRQILQETHQGLEEKETIRAWHCYSVYSITRTNNNVNTLVLFIRTSHTEGHTAKTPATGGGTGGNQLQKITLILLFFYCFASIFHCIVPFTW